MMLRYSIIIALILGVVEGVTEFIPVSSTAHLLLVSRLLGADLGSSFIVLVQLGAVSALLYVYFGRILSIFVSFPFSAAARHFTITLFLGFFPTVVCGFFAYNFIKSILFKEMIIIHITLIIGGFILLLVDRLKFESKYFHIENYPIPLAIKIGLFQCIAMIPGTSRSGATITGALILGADKRSAAEFSFFIAIPTIIGACVLDFYKNYNVIVNNIGKEIIIGFMASFITSLLVIRSLFQVIAKRGYTPFALWRILIGFVGLFLEIFP
ncbi:undecaprenyl pyrophosphate phosphatase [Candidatus Liberibacter asiaticus str. Ishi-1]|nr:undecaprenyl pyrophosphate phosphatase [Candidatus Liberibacter asiaticus str. Ishi-1]